MALASPTVSPQLLACARQDRDAALLSQRTTSAGLDEEEVLARQAQYGPNDVAEEHPPIWLVRLLRTYYRDPLSILLTVLVVISYLSGDMRATVVIGAMVVLSVMLRFVQEAKADAAAAKLKAMINITATVVRGGARREVPLAQLVPGDIVALAAGDMIPADVRVLSAKDLFISQSSLTGESFPIEKFEAVESRADVPPLELSNVCFMGTNVESGTATALVVATGRNTYFGGMARSIVGQQVATSFDLGVKRFTWLMVKFMVVMTPTVFLINGFTKGDWGEAFMFALAVAVGLTPEMLPMIVSVCLAKGALSMSRVKVIVKRLNAIQNFGAMDVLCTDKTGTLTLDRVVLEKHCDVVKQESDAVLSMAYINSYFQTGLKNVLDRAILTHTEAAPTGCQKLDEIPFDFSRKLMSVVVDMGPRRAGLAAAAPAGSGIRLIAKGAPEAIAKRCTRFELNGKIFPMDPLVIEDLAEEHADLSADGFRVLALAYKDVEKKPAYSKADESDLTLFGYVAFFDPPKDSAAEALALLHKHEVRVKVLTGDNELVTKKICQEVGLDGGRVVLGTDVAKLNDAELADVAENAVIFARMSPADKRRVIMALKSRGHTVGYMGDGINDAPALRAADVGISVDTAVDIAREAADIILLEKSLLVLEHGVIEGRKVFANILKYVKMGASSNFGNMFSVIGASAFLPFLPMRPVQVLANNLLYDFSQVPIPTDDVDEEFTARPQPWNMRKLTRFILFIGPISSIFDYTTFFVMLYVFNCWDVTHQGLFQAGWFVESLATQTLIVHIIRTNRVPFAQSRASWPLTVMSLVIILVGAAIPFTPLGTSLGFKPLPALYWPILVLTLLAYGLLCHGVKMWLVRRQLV